MAEGEYWNGAVLADDDKPKEPGMTPLDLYLAIVTVSSADKELLSAVQSMVSDEENS